MQGVFNTHPTRLSETTRDKLAKVIATILIAIIVVCVIVVVWTLIQDCAIGSRPGPRSTPASTAATMPNRPSVYYRNCAEAHAAGRWDIPEGDPAYRPGLDKDHNGIACESRKSSRLAGR
ncbi:hypothetical protein MINTM011_32750 [Mycobacterium paraintracellulare]|nr:hypothetical protein MINTM011_32750 [Mycobacterium paraintracellulare]BCO90243.1 hypothetical protein MINTM015_35000 [Mycobacterium paraintracellulare]